MDQIAATGLKLLAEYKKALDKAKEQVEVARQLSRRIEIFEVTITMIPSRGDKDQVKQMVEAVPGESYEERKLIEVDESGESTDKAEAEKRADALKKYGEEATEHISSQVHGMAMNHVTNLISASPLAHVADLVQSFAGENDNTPIIGDIRPAEILQRMRARGESDLNVSFAAMSFLIHNALKIVDEAVQDVLKIGIPNIFWLIMPWKVMQQNEVGKALAGHLEALDKFNAQLQSAISIASYCVSLEQLENVLDATSMILNKTIREFWKKKIGVSNVKVKMDELAESFLNHIDQDIAKYKVMHHHLKEKFGNMREAPEVALGRLLSNLWNSNGDEWLTVYELNTNTEKYGKDGDAIQITTQKLFELEQLFMSKIEFFPLLIDGGHDHIIGNDDDELVLKDTHEIHAKHGVILNSNDMVITVKPFQRLTILCKVPRFNKDFFPHDCIAILKYDKVSTVKELGLGGSGAIGNSDNENRQFYLHEVEGTRAYLSAEVNSEFHHRDVYYWNAPEAIVRKRNKEELTLPDGTILSDNFLETKIVDDETAGDEGPSTGSGTDGNNSSNSDGKKAVNTDKVLEEGGISTLCTMIYTPTIRKPGIYTVRLVLDDLDIDSHDDMHSTAFKKKLLLSQKNYYYNRSAEEREIFTSTRGAAICTTIEGLGMNNFKHYVDLTLQLYELDVEEVILQQQANSNEEEDDDDDGDDGMGGTMACNANSGRNQLHMIHIEKEKFILANQDKILDYENEKREKDLANSAAASGSKDTKDTQKEKDLVALRAMLHMDEDVEENPDQVELNVILDDIITKKEEQVAAELTKKGRRQSNAAVAAAAATSAVSAPSTAAVPSETKSTNNADPLKSSSVPPAIQMPKETIEKMHENPMFAARRASINAVSIPPPPPPVPSANKPSISSAQFEEIRNLAAFVLKYCHDPTAIDLENGSSLANSTPASAAVVPSNPPAESKEHEIHHHKKKIVEILEVDLYKNYAKEVLECVKSDLLQEEEFEYKKIVLAKIVILLKLTKVIVLVEDHIASTLKTWRDMLPNATSSILQQVDNSLREHKGLLSEHRLVRETIEEMIEASPVYSSHSRVLMHLPGHGHAHGHAHDESIFISNEMAAKALIHDGQLALFIQYCRIKISLYTLDAKESKSNVDIHRLILLEKAMSDLNDLMVKVSKGKFSVSNDGNNEKSTTTEVIKMIRNVLQPTREVLKKERNHHRVYWDHLIVFEDREKAKQELVIFLKNLSTYNAKLSEKLLEEHDLSVDVIGLREKIDNVLKLKHEFDMILSHVKHSAPKLIEISPFIHHHHHHHHHHQQHHNVAEMGSSGDLTTITIEALTPKTYFNVVELALHILDYDLQDAVKLSGDDHHVTNVNHMLRIQQLKVEKEAMLKAIKDNVSRFESDANNVKEFPEVCEDLHALIDIHDRSVTCEVIDIKFDSFLEDLKVDTVVETTTSSKGSGLASPASVKSPPGSPVPNSSALVRTATLKNHKSVSWSKKTKLSLKDSLTIAVREFEANEKQLFPISTDADHVISTAHNRLTHIMNSIPRSAYDELIKEVKSALAEGSHTWTKHMIQELEKIHLILCKIIALYKLTLAIRDVDNMIIMKLQEWFDGLPISRSITLKDIQQSIHEQMVLVHRHHQLIETLREDISETSNVNVSETCFLLDFEQEDTTSGIGNIDKIASESLVVKNQLQLFIRYYLTKAYCYAVDVHEAIEIQDMRRLEMVEKRVNGLNDLMVKLQLKKEQEEEKEKETAKGKNNNESAEETKEEETDKKGGKSSKQKEKEKSASMTLGAKEVKRRIRDLLEKEQYYSKSSSRQQQLLRDYSRRSVVEHINAFMIDLNKFMKHLTDQQHQLQKSTSATTSGTKKRANMAMNIALTTRIDQLKEISHIFHGIITRAAMTPPINRTSYQNVTTPIIPPHGLIIHVENKNAMAWGQVVIQANEWDRPRAHNHYIKTVTPVPENGENPAEGNTGDGSGSGNGEEEEEKRVWRPLISFEYPYHTVKTLHTSMNLLTNSEDEEHPIFAVFHHTVKSSEKKVAVKGNAVTTDGATAGNDQTSEEKKNGIDAADEDGAKVSQARFMKATPTHIALYRLRFDASHEDGVHVTVEDLDDTMVGTAFELTKAADKDFTEVDLKIMLGDKVSEFTGGDQHFYFAFVAKIGEDFGIVEDSPVLHLHIHEKDEDYYYDYYDSDEESDEESDDDSDESDYYYGFGNDSDEEQDGGEDDEDGDQENESTAHDYGNDEGSADDNDGSGED